MFDPVFRVALLVLVVFVLVRFPRVRHATFTVLGTVLMVLVGAVVVLGALGGALSHGTRNALMAIDLDDDW